MRMRGAMGLIVVAALLSCAGRAAAQNPFDGLKLEGGAEAGIRFLPKAVEPQRRATFEEYRDIPQGAFLQDLNFRLSRPDESYSTQLYGSKWGQLDQEFGLRAGRLGLWDFGFSWDQTPHLISTTARSLGTEPQPGMFVLPTPRPALTAWGAPPALDEVRLRWDTARLSLLVTPTPDLDLRADYTRIRKTGDRPIGMAFTSPGGNFREVLEPIDQTIHDFRLKAVWVGEGWQFQTSYAFSMFDQGRKTFQADNPCFALVACGGDAAGPATGLAALAPDNMAHTWNVAGGVTLPFRTRLTANASYSLRMQNESFVGHTINPIFAGNPTLALPSKSLDGNVGVTLLNFNVTSRPIAPLTVTFKYRLFDLHDMTGEIPFPQTVTNDNALSGEPLNAVRESYTKQNADLDARIKLFSPVAFTLGTAWEQWDRSRTREAPRSDEYFAKAAVDATPWDWLLARLTYRPSIRRITSYNTFAQQVRADGDADFFRDVNEAASSQSVLLRKFDEGERNTQRADLLLQITPLETLTASLSGGYRNDHYAVSPLGLQEKTTWSAGADVTWSPVERVSFFAGYVHELIFQKQESRSRPVTGTTTFDFPDYDWISDNVDTIDTYRLGVNAVLIPGTLDWASSASYSVAIGQVLNRNAFGAPVSGTADQNASATAQRFPATGDKLLRVDTSLRYHFARQWWANLGYTFEAFDQKNWQTDTLNPFMPGVTSIWLGNDLRNYTAHIVALTLAYQFR